MKKVLVQFNFPGMKAEQYDQVWEDLEAAGQTNPKGLVHHVGAPSADGWLVVDVWESREHFNEFGKTLIPLLKKNRVPEAEPLITPLHFVYNGSHVEIY
jgi:hypothetical protein